MDLRDTPGYHLHRALSNLRSIETDDLSMADRRRVEVATLLLSDVTVRAEVGDDGSADEIATPHPDSDDR